MSLPLHPHLVREIVLCLEEIFQQGKYADKVIEKAFKAHRKWGSRDRKFFAETVYEIVRHRRLLENAVGKTDNMWALIAAYLIKQSYEVPPWEEFQAFDRLQISNRLKEVKAPQIKYSFPDWLDELGKSEFGSEWPNLMQALNQPAEVFLRVNTLKITPEKLMDLLKTEDVETEKIQTKSFEFPNCLKLKKRKNVFTTQAFKKGFFEVQDAASQLVAPLLDPQPGERMADACAGAGGKSLHLAMLMKNKGKIISMDIHDWKLKELKTRAARNGVDIIETKLIESSKTIKRFEGSFQHLLLDVPCSGLGVLRRNPDTKWKLSNEEINRLVELQRDLLRRYSKMCSVGGTMVYATCSILHRENEEQTKWFLNSEEGLSWSLEKELRVWPHIDGFDGFYAAKFKRKG